jgi:probable rRNA maturation factor
MIEINNLTSFAVDKNSFSQVAKIVLKGENEVLKTFSLAFVKAEEIKKLNKKFRSKNKPTDVLSFLLEEDNYAGEIIICPEEVKENAKKDKKPVNEEMMRVFIHGILHLLGYDHEKNIREAEIMEAKQEKYLKEFLSK